MRIFPIGIDFDVIFRAGGFLRANNLVDLGACMAGNLDFLGNKKEAGLYSVSSFFMLITRPKTQDNFRE